MKKNETELYSIESDMLSYDLHTNRLIYLIWYAQLNFGRAAYFWKRNSIQDAQPNLTHISIWDVHFNLARATQFLTRN